MNSSERSAKDRVKASVPVQLASNWIEIFAVPIAAAIMETQPILLVMQMLAPRFLGEESIIPDAASILLIMVGLQWWSMFVNHYLNKRGIGAGGSPIFSLVGVILAALLVGLIHIMELDNIPMLFLFTGIILWSWKRGVDRTRESLQPEPLILAFKVGFSALLVVIAFSILQAGTTPIGEEITSALPIFFLSGIIALSFTNIGRIQKERQQNPEVRSGRKESTGSWLAAMTLVWVLVVVASVMLEALPLQFINNLFSPFGIVLSWLGEGMLYILSIVSFIAVYLFVLIESGALWLYKLIFKASLAAQPAKPVTPKLSAMMPAVPHNGQGSSLLFWQLLLAVLAAIAIIFMINATRRNKKAVRLDHNNDEEEVRESLNIGDILKQRRQERKQGLKDPLRLEPLTPGSARARYRDFLVAMAEKREDLVRKVDETPTEYQKRVLNTIRSQPSIQANGNAPSDPEILTELTEAYARERYGGKYLDNERQNYLTQWAPLLMRRLLNAIQPAASSTVAPRPARKSGWGE